MNSNRRGFLKSMLAAAVGSSILLPAFKDTHKWKRLPESFICVPNPEYVTAPYEISFVHTVGCMDETVFRKVEPGELVTPLGGDRYPYRFDKNKNPVFPFLRIKESESKAFREYSDKMCREWRGIIQ